MTRGRDGQTRPLRIPVLPGGRQLRPGAVLSVAVLAVVAAGLGTWAARWNSIGKSDAVALRPASGVVPKTVTYTEAGAYSIRVPAGWRSERQGPVMEWDDERSGRGLRVSPASGDALDSLRADERAAVTGRLYPGYHRLRLETVPELGANAAEWEFTWDGEHGGEHVLCRRLAGYEFRFIAPGPHWKSGQRLYDRILRSFEPERN